MTEREQFPMVDVAHEVAKTMSEGDPDLMLQVLEKKAANAMRMRQWVETLMVGQTYPGDWTIQGDKACLSSAGAERIGRHFPIRYHDVQQTREDFTDTEGKGYRYVFRGYATFNDRTVYAEGNYSTRDEFLGKKSGAWRPLEDINEGDIRSAAMHIFQGNAIKQLLGLRGIPASEYQRIMQGTGQQATRTTTVERGKGTQGGTAPDDRKHQTELQETCLAIVHAGFTAENDGKNCKLVPLAESSDKTDVQLADDLCVIMSGFVGDKGPVNGRTPNNLKGKWLESTRKRALGLKGQLPASPTMDSWVGDGDPTHA
ncbi:MAG: hypothetical protein WC683_06020 [bacterium]